MYLKNIEVYGFKSFANKINFQFHNGITGIVGPNGSGKSNVADAVRWVLGEQRVKQLRGASMQDVIFSGTEARKPLSYAYVAITLDNSDHSLAIDYEEVTVARRIYRSGESEYLINGNACRLKDVNELFYDTGIGKEGYSIIGQGQIDKILSGKPEERRELFDEAAGIVKFKRRKSEALKKLQEEQDNLVRVNDILTELEKQVRPLERQAEVAKVYLLKRDELRTLDVNVFLLEHKRLMKELEQIEADLAIASRDLRETTEKYEGIRTEYEDIQEEIARLDTEIEEARTGLSQADVLRGQLEGEIKVLEEQIRSAEENRGHFEVRRSGVQSQVDEKMAERDGILSDKEAIDAQVAELREQRDRAKEELEQIQTQIQELNDRIENDKNAIIGELNQRATIKSKMGRYDTMLEQIMIRKAELNSRVLRMKSDEATQAETIKELTAQFEAVGEEIRTMNEQAKSMEQELVTVRGQLANADELQRSTQEQYHQEKSKLEALSNLTERYEGYGGSVKKVMEQKERVKGIIGVVADIIKVARKYETAIETALGGNIQNIVTDDEETAKKMIAFLKEGRHGRATFLPLTSIRNPQEFKTPEVLKEKGVIGMADELVDIEDRYRDVAKAMLGRIVVVDNVDNAVRIARKYEYGIRMVTLEGELLVPGGAISGGAFKNNSNLLGRRREMEELEKNVAKLLKKTEELQALIEETKTKRNQMRFELETLKGDIQRKFIEQNTARLNVEAARSKMEETSQDSMALKEEEQEIEKQILEIKGSKDDIQRELETSEALEKDTEREIEELAKKLESLRGEETEKSRTLSEWELKMEKMLQTQEFHKQNEDRILAELHRYEEELKEIRESIDGSLESVEEKKANIEKIKATIEESYSFQDRSRQELSDKTKRREELTEKQRNFFNEREAIAEQKNNLDKEVYRLESQKQKLEESVENQINYMWDQYEITLSAAAAIRNEEMTDLSAMKKEIESLKDQIKKLGNVNVNAIEDYKVLMERYTFLKTQHDDLVASEKTLSEIITDLDSAMRKQFNEKFGEIGKEFDKVFKELFGGGKGSLELQEDTDVLEAGIRIIAQPPGKKLQNMMQLSGGEKALTAIALLFAIQNLKPSPFCLLDEIEAALDESNVGRFAGYLHKLTKHTQFIVITHRRGTMEKADRLYGITMQEKGVSTLVSVNLIDQQLDN